MVKNPPANAGDLDSIPGSGRFPGEGSGIFAWEMPVDRGAWWATVYGSLPGKDFFFFLAWEILWVKELGGL